MSETEHRENDGLLSIKDLFTKAWQLYNERRWSLLAMAAMAILLPILSIAPFVVLGTVVSPFLPGLQTPAIAISVLLGIAAMMWFGSWSWAALITTIADQRCSFKEAFKRAKPKIVAYMWLGILTGFIITGAHMLLIIPGILFTVWFFFAPFVFIEEDERGLGALLKSKAYVQGRWVPVALRVFAVWLIFLLIGCIPVIGQLLCLFLIPLSLIYTHVLYKDLKKTGKDLTFEPTKRDKATVVATGAVGIALPVALVFVFMGSMALMPFSMLKASLTDTAPAHQASLQTSKTGKTTFAIPKKTVPPAHHFENDVQTLKDMNQDWTKRAQAAFKLGISKEPRAVSPLVTALKADKQWAVRKNAVQALCALQATQVVPELIQVLGSDENVFVRKEAAVALGQLGDKQAIAPLQKALLDQGVVTQMEKDKEIPVKAVAKAAQKALERLGNVPKPATTTPTVVASAGAPAPGKPAAKAPQAKKTAQIYSKPKPLSGKEAKKYRDMIEACNKAVKIQPSDSLAYHNRAVAHFKLGEYGKAIQDFTLAIKYNPKDANAYYNRAIAHGLQGKHKEAVADGVKAIELQPQNANAYVNRGIDYMALGQWKEAVSDFTQAIQVNTKDAAAFYARAVAHQQLGEKKKADADFAKASQLGSQKAKVYLEALKKTSS